MKHIIFVLFILISIQTLFSQKQYSFSENLSNDTGNIDLEIKLEIAENELKSNKRYNVKYSIHNKNTSFYVYNPFFNGLIQYPAQLVIYDADKKYIADLIQHTGGSRKGIGNEDFVYLLHDSVVGGRLSFIAGKTAWGQEIPSSKNNKYFLQMVFHKGFLFAPSTLVLKNKKYQPYFYVHFFDTECCRSNILEIKINKDKNNR